MPSFGKQLPLNEREDLASYVIHLSFRGRVEYDTIVNAFDYDPAKDTLTFKSEEGTLEEYPFNAFELVLRAWHESQGKEIVVEPYPYKDWEGAEGNKVMTQDLKNSIARPQAVHRRGQGQARPAQGRGQQGGREGGQLRKLPQGLWTASAIQVRRVGHHRQAQRFDAEPVSRRPPARGYLLPGPFRHQRLGHERFRRHLQGEGKQGAHMGPGELRADPALPGHAPPGGHQAQLT